MAAAATQSPTKAEKAAKLMADPQVVHSNYVPAQLHRQLEFVDFNKDGHLVLGCSDLTGRTWTGSLWYYRDPEEAPSVEKALTGVECDQGVVDGKFVAKDRMIVALDNGSVEQISLTFSDETDIESFFYLERDRSIQEHDDIITGMDITCDSKTLVTCSYDQAIVSLNLKTLGLETRFNGAHNSLISSISANKLAASLIATAANDGMVKTWDLRTSTQQSCIFDDSSVWPTCVEWIPNSEHHILIGSQTGKVSIVDVRKPKQELTSEKSIANHIHKFQFSSKRPDLFSVCGDAVSVMAFQVSETFDSITAKLSDHQHDDFVRGMAWHPSSDKLFTCGWDHKVFCHPF